MNMCGVIMGNLTVTTPSKRSDSPGKRRGKRKTREKRGNTERTENKTGQGNRKKV